MFFIKTPAETKFHPLHVSTTDVSFNAKDSQLEIICTIFTSGIWAKQSAISERLLFDSKYDSGDFAINFLRAKKKLFNTYVESKFSRQRLVPKSNRSGGGSW